MTRVAGDVMQCEALAGTLGGLIDGSLDPDEQRAVERHLERCATCRALVSDLRTIRAAAFTLEQHEPPAHVWAGVRARLESEVRPAARRGSRWWPAQHARSTWLAAAALLLATTAGIGSLLMDRGAGVTPATEAGAGSLLETVQSELQQAEAHYQKAIDGLEAIAREETGELDPQVAAVLQKNLQVIDQAIGESRAALRVQPASMPAQDSLFEAMRSKVSLLQQTVELINEMRKGNQAETARIVEGLGPT